MFCFMHSLLCVYAVGSTFLCTCLSLHSSGCWYALTKTVKYMWKCIKACVRLNHPWGGEVFKIVLCAGLVLSCSLPSLSLLSWASQVHPHVIKLFFFLPPFYFWHHSCEKRYKASAPSQLPCSLSGAGQPGNGAMNVCAVVHLILNY